MITDEGAFKNLNILRSKRKSIILVLFTRGMSIIDRVDMRLSQGPGEIFLNSDEIILNQDYDTFRIALRI